MKRRDFLLGTICGGLWSLFPFKKKQVQADTCDSIGDEITKKPKIINFGSILGLIYDDELVFGTWEYSWFSNFEHYGVFSPRVCFDFYHYTGPRYIRAHVFGLYAEEIFDTWKKTFE